MSNDIKLSVIGHQNWRKKSSTIGRKHWNFIYYDQHIKIKKHRYQEFPVMKIARISKLEFFFVEGCQQEFSGMRVLKLEKIP